MNNQVWMVLTEWALEEERGCSIELFEGEKDARAYYRKLVDDERRRIKDEGYKIVDPPLDEIEDDSPDVRVVDEDEDSFESYRPGWYYEDYIYIKIECRTPQPRSFTPPAKPCPICGNVPQIGYACEESFVVGTDGCEFCGHGGTFTEVCSNEYDETEAWNNAVDKASNHA